MKALTKALYIIIGVLSLALGIIGIFLPVLPTTPFLLLSAFCFARSSKRLYNWLMHHKILGRYIHNYVKHKAIEKNARRTTLIMLWLTISISAFFAPLVPVKIMLIVTASLVTWHIMSLNVIKETSN